MKSYKIGEKFYLNEQEVELESKELKVEPKHQYIIIDRSGSMWRDLNLVIDTIINYVDTLPEGSTVSVGYFSGYGEYGLSVPYELKKEKQGIVKTVESYRHSMGCTNFVEILEKIKTDCRQRNSSLFFFTDGCHNCGSFNGVLDVLNELKQYLEVSVFVGCGWINRENMVQMAQLVDGSFIQLNGFDEFKETLHNFGETVGESCSTQQVAVPQNADNICSVLGKNVIYYTKDDSNMIKYKSSNKKKQVIYFTSETPIYNEENISNRNEVCARTLIYNLVQTNQVPLALQILNVLGDKHYINRLYNTYTEDEYAEVEKDLLMATYDSRKRYKEGKVCNYLPSDDARCVLDVLDIVLNDDDALVHLNDKEFIYESVSRKSEQTDGSKLQYPKDIKANANNLKYNENRLNVNLNVSYKADVPLIPSEFKQTNAINESLDRYNLKNTYQVNCIRNYNIILDGKLQTKKLILSNLKKDTINKLANELTLRNDKKYVLDLSGLPLINKSYLSNTSANKLAVDCWNSFLLNNEISVLKYLKNKLTTISTSEVSLDLESFLADNYYIKNGMYQPPKTTVEATDEYTSYEFNVSFKGYSKASASSVIKKIQDGKNVTEREKIVAHYYDKYKDYTLSNLDTMLKAKNIEYRSIQTNIQHAKFAIILINRGCMDEFRSREDMSLEIDTSSSNLGINKVTTVFKVEKKSFKI